MTRHRRGEPPSASRSVGASRRHGRRVERVRDLNRQNDIRHAVPLGPEPLATRPCGCGADGDAARIGRREWTPWQRPFLSLGGRVWQPRTENHDSVRAAPPAGVQIPPGPLPTIVSKSDCRVSGPECGVATGSGPVGQPSTARVASATAVKNPFFPYAAERLHGYPGDPLQNYPHNRSGEGTTPLARWHAGTRRTDRPGGERDPPTGPGGLESRPLSVAVRTRRCPSAVVRMWELVNRGVKDYGPPLYGETV